MSNVCLILDPISDIITLLIHKDRAGQLKDKHDFLRLSS